MSDTAIEKRIYVGGLHQSVTEDLLRGRFSKFGSVTDASIAKNDQGVCRGFGHLTIHTTPKQWTSCLSLYNRSKWKGQVMRIEEAKPDYMERKRINDEERERREEKKRKRLARLVNWNQVDGIQAKDMSRVTDRNMESRRGWKRGRYGRAIAVMRLKRPNGTQIVYDPTHYKNNLTKLYDVQAPMKPVSKLPMFFEDTVTEEKESVHENGSMNEEDSVKEEELESGKSSFPVVSTASTEKRYQVNVNMKPLFGGQQAEPFKLFGGDEEQVEEETQSKATFFDEEPKERNANFVPVGQRTARTGLQCLFFFHTGDPKLMQRSCLDYKKDGIFQRDITDDEEYQRMWQERRRQVKEILRKRQKSAMSRHRRLKERGLK